MENCKHINQIRDCLRLDIFQPENWRCSICSTTEGVMACLTCSNLACGYYISEHAYLHFLETNHPVAYDFKDRLVFCYECADLVVNDNPSGDIKIIRMALEGVKDTSISTVNLRTRLNSNQESSLASKLEIGNVQNLLVKLRRSRLMSLFCDWRKILNYKTKLDSSDLTDLTFKPIKSPGLRNLGNTCYINSVLQALNHTPAFSDFVRCNTFKSSQDISLKEYTHSSSPEIQCRLNGGSTSMIKNQNLPLISPSTKMSIYEEMHLLFNKLNRSSKQRAVNPRNLVRALWQAIPTFRGSSQQDAQELMTIMLDQLQSELEPITNTQKWDPNRQNFVTRVFQGQLENSIVCQNCLNVIVKTEPFLDLSLCFPRSKRHSIKSNSDNLLDSDQINRFDDKNYDDDSESLELVHLLDEFVSDNPIIDTNYCKNNRKRKINHSSCFGNVIGLNVNNSLNANDNQSFLCYKCPVCCRKKDNLAETINNENNSTFSNLSDNSSSMLGLEVDLNKNDISFENKYQLTSDAPNFVKATQQIRLSKLPRVLRLHLKRFRLARNSRQKISSHVSFPLNLDLVPYVSTKLLDDTDVINSLYYHLTAVIVHQGRGIQTGHYIAYCMQDDTFQNWFQFNDSQVVKCSVEDVLSAQAYILFYTQFKYSTNCMQLNNRVNSKEYYFWSKYLDSASSSSCSTMEDRKSASESDKCRIKPDQDDSDLVSQNVKSSISHPYVLLNRLDLTKISQLYPT